MNQNNVNQIFVKGTWKVAADLDSALVFPIVTTSQRPDVVVWSDDAKQVILLELTVPWEENFGDAEDRKYRRYEELIDACKEAGWNPEYYHLAVGFRGYVSRELANLMRGRFGFTTREQRTLVAALQQAAEKASYFIWLKRDDKVWLGYFFIFFLTHVPASTSSWEASLGRGPAMAEGSRRVGAETVCHGSS
ncbi:hypothetical protein ACROYT_G023902 [Oculina patagonica]